MYIFLDFFFVTMNNLDLEFVSSTLYSDCVEDFIYHFDWKLFPFCLRASMHNFDNLLFIKEIVSIFKTATLLIYLPGLNIKLKEERKSHMNVKIQGNLEPEGGGVYFSGLYMLGSALLFYLSVTILRVSFGLCWCNILSLYYVVHLFPPRQGNLCCASYRPVI